MDSKEFRKQYGLAQECEQFAVLYPNVTDFWENCPDSGCMISLLDGIGYRQSESLWEYGKELVRLLTEDGQPDQLTRRLESFLQYNEEIAQRYGSQDWRWNYTQIVVEDALRDHINHVRYMEIVRAVRAGTLVENTETERSGVLELATTKATIETRRLQADLLRRVIKDPRPHGVS